jgi:hypothetical protein
MMSNEFPSPNGKFNVVLYPTEMRMSHWVWGPTLMIGETNLLDMSQSFWSADSVTWSPDSKNVTLSMRRYPGDKFGVTVILDTESLSAQVRCETGEQTEVLMPGLENWLEQYYQHSPKRQFK